MRYLSLTVALLVTGPASAAPPQFVVDNRVPGFTVQNHVPARNAAPAGYRLVKRQECFTDRSGQKRCRIVTELVPDAAASVAAPVAYSGCACSAGSGCNGECLSGGTRQRYYVCPTTHAGGGTCAVSGETRPGVTYVVPNQPAVMAGSCASCGTAGASDPQAYSQPAFGEPAWWPGKALGRPCPAWRQR